ncbi:MAG: hypothetical protein ACI9M6_001261, partial [Hydrogenophaga sp.]
MSRPADEHKENSKALRKFQSFQLSLKIQKVLAKLPPMTLQDQLPSLNREFIAHFGEMGS